METPGLKAAAAGNLAGWHDAHLRALGLPTQVIDDLWLTTACVPNIFFSAISLRPGASAATAAGLTPIDRWVAISDPLATFGWTRMVSWPTPSRAWLVRDPKSAAAAAPQTPAELRIKRVTDPDELHDFELASAAGFGSAPQPRATWHAPPDPPRSPLHDPARTGRRPDVAASMSFRDADVLGVYGVSTLPEARQPRVRRSHDVSRHDCRLVDAGRAPGERDGGAAVPPAGIRALHDLWLLGAITITAGTIR